MEIEGSNDKDKRKETPDWTLSLDSYQVQLVNV